MYHNQVQAGQQSHSILIRNFGPIEELKLEIKDFLVFIGQQATGKSTVSKLIYFFRTVKDEMFEHFEEEIRAPNDAKNTFTNSIQDFIDKMNNKLLLLFGVMSKDKSSYISYNYGNEITIELTSHINTRGKNRGRYILKFDMNDTLNSSFKELFKKSQSIEQKNWTDSFSDKLQRLFNDYVEVVYLPAGRISSMFFSFKRSKNYLINRSYGYMSVSCMDYDDYKRDEFLPHIREDDELIKLQSYLKYADELINDILKGVYRNESSEKNFDDETDPDRLYINDSEYVEMKFTSSGQQDSFAILMNLHRAILRKLKIFFIIEEPEAHLYPAAQKRLVELISYVANTTNSKFIINTHSPYILTSLNNLIFANNVAKKCVNEKKVSDIVDKMLWVDIDKVGVFELEGGKCTDIIDSELSFIKAEAIDKASDEIEDIFEQLFEIK